MAFAVTNLATTSNLSGATLATGALAAIPAGSGVLVFVSEISNVTPGGSVADNAGTGNSYSAIAGASLNGIQANGFLRCHYAENASAASGKIITVTKAVSGAATNLSACYVTGVATSGSIDTAATATNTGSGRTFSVTSGTPANANNFAVAMTAAVAPGGFTQAAGFSTPPNGNGPGSPFANLNGGSKTTSGAGTTSYSMTNGFPNSVGWAALIVELAAASGTAYTLAAAQGSLLETGKAAAMAFAFRLPATYGACALAGKTAGLARGYIVSAARGAFTLAGRLVGFLNALKLSAANGLFGFAGAPCVFRGGDDEMWTPVIADPLDWTPQASTAESWIPQTPAASAWTAE